MGNARPMLRILFDCRSFYSNRTHKRIHQRTNYAGRLCRNIIIPSDEQSCGEKEWTTITPTLPSHQFCTNIRVSIFFNLHVRVIKA